ncbi:hypothetical protein SADUNF_Sadunf06G0015600 [Salix dunnii]|uniref:Uncharacterized protein n=1 Tax=Salix dunnii TaxID=1413687 RepID=A0A835K0R7_9ROSI|nr:hypothetical protein SADUNF_Sadunf06G0015600 [Salix dunnii]
MNGLVHRGEGTLHSRITSSGYSTLRKSKMATESVSAFNVINGVLSENKDKNYTSLLKEENQQEDSSIVSDLVKANENLTLFNSSNRRKAPVGDRERTTEFRMRRLKCYDKDASWNGSNVVIAIIRSHKSSLGVLTIWQGDTKFLSILILAWGLVASIDFEYEKYRRVGSASPMGITSRGRSYIGPRRDGQTKNNN